MTLPRPSMFGLVLAAGVALIAAMMLAPRTGVMVSLALIGLALASRSPGIPLALWSLSDLVGLLGPGVLPAHTTVVAFSAWTLIGVVIFAVRRAPGQVRLREGIDITILSFAFLIAFMFLRLASSSVPSYGTQKVELMLLSVAVPGVAAVLIASSQQARAVYMRWLIGALGATAIYASILLSTGSAAQVNSQRFTPGSTFDPIGFGRDMGTLILILLIGLVGASTGRRRVVMALLLVPATLSLVGSGSRGPLIGLTISAVVVVLARSNDPRMLRRLFGALTGFGVVAAILIAALVPASTVARALSAFTGQDTATYEMPRALLWQKTIKELRASPLTIVIGEGTGSYARIDPNYAYPHNIELELLFETGVIGLIAFGVGVVNALRLLAKIAFSRQPEAALAALVLALLVNALVNAQFSADLAGNSQVFVWAAFGCGLTAAIRHRGRAARAAVALQPVHGGG